MNMEISNIVALISNNNLNLIKKWIEGFYDITSLKKEAALQISN